MYTRIVEITSKSGKSRELCNTIEEKVVPILKKRTGFWTRPFWCRTRTRTRFLG